MRRLVGITLLLAHQAAPSPPNPPSSPPAPPSAPKGPFFIVSFLQLMTDPHRTTQSQCPDTHESCFASPACEFYWSPAFELCYVKDHGASIGGLTAARDFNARNPTTVAEFGNLQYCNLQMVIGKVSNSATTTDAVQAVVGEITQQAVPDVFIGPRHSDTSIATAPITGVLGIAQVAFAASAPTLDDTQTYPYFLRTNPSDTTTAILAVDFLIVDLAYSRFAILNRNDVFGDGLRNKLVSLAAAGSNNATIESYAYSPELSSSVTTQVEAFSLSTLRVVVVVEYAAEQFNYILDEASSLGLVGDTGYLWNFIGGGAVSGSIFSEVRADAHIRKVPQGRDRGAIAGADPDGPRGASRQHSDRRAPTSDGQVVRLQEHPVAKFQRDLFQRPLAGRVGNSRGLLPRELHAARPRIRAVHRRRVRRRRGGRTAGLHGEPQPHAPAHGVRCPALPPSPKRLLRGAQRQRTTSESRTRNLPTTLLKVPPQTPHRHPPPSLTTRLLTIS